MKNILFYLLIIVSHLSYSQILWQETNTGTSCTISIGEFSVWNMNNPTLDGEPLPEGSLIGESSLLI